MNIDPISLPSILYRTKANAADLDQTLQNVVSDQTLRCLQDSNSKRTRTEYNISDTSCIAKYTLPYDKDGNFI